MIKFNIIIFLYLINFLILIRLIFPSISLNNKFIHPTFIGRILILYRIILSLNLRIFFKNQWFSYIIFLTIIRGIIILFIYFIRFINNIKILTKNYSFISIFLINIILILLFIIYFIYKNNYFWIENRELNNINNLFINNIINNFIKINFIYYYNKNFQTIICIIYLFFCLTLIVKICIINKYSLRKINYEKINFNF